MAGQTKNPYATDRAFIRSVDNPDFALSVKTGTAASPVFLESIGKDEWNTPLSQWVLTPVAEDIYQIALFASAGGLLLQAAAATAGSALQVAAPSTDESQLWQLEASAPGQFWLVPQSAIAFEAGFPGDYPVRGLAITLQPGHDQHHSGDKFTVTLVSESLAASR